MKFTKILFSLVFMLMSFAVLGQQARKDRVELQGADSLKGGIFNGQRITKLLGNVKFKQQDTFLFADSVYKYADTEILEAFGNVRINQADTVTITGNRATYDGDKRTARMIGNVVMRDPRMTLTTPSLDYDMSTRTAIYTEGGTIVDPENRLQSRRGTYDTNSKMFTFQQDVKVFSKDSDITAENMRYNSESKIVYFQGPTFIKGKQGDLYAEEGTYDSVRRISDFGKNAYILTPEYRIGGEKLFYNEGTGYAHAQQNVTMRSLKNDVTIRGQVGKYWREAGVAKVYGNPKMETLMDGDTLFLAADTLISKESKTPDMPSMLYAYHGVKIYKSDLQGKCDSLSYNRTDSIMYMNRNPVLWSDNSQIVSDTIHVHMRNKTIDRMYMFSNAFISSEDSIQNFNQVKGRDMVAFFKEGKIRRVNVEGNGESLYHVLEGDTVLTGLNKAVCSNMVLKFSEENKLNTISFLVSPDASFIPPHELKEPDKTLEGFEWLSELRPERKDIFVQRVPVAQPQPVQQGPKASGTGSATPPARVKPVVQTKPAEPAKPPVNNRVPSKPATPGGTRLKKAGSN